MKDLLGDLQKRLPRGAVPTSVPGVFALPPLPDAFDANVASPAALLRNGFSWKRPEENDHPALVAAWKNAFSQPWERVIPRMEVGDGRGRRSQDSKLQFTETNSFLTGAVCKNPFTDITRLVSVNGQWTVPLVKKPSDNTPSGNIQNLPGEKGWDSSSWIGIGGFEEHNDGTKTNLLQVGVQHYVKTNGDAGYVAFFQWLVAGADDSQFQYVNQINTDLLIRPDDTVLGNVQYNGQFGQVSLGNLTTGKNFSMPLTPPTSGKVPNTAAPFTGSSAEWIVEAQGGDINQAHPPDFTKVIFTDAITCGGQPEPVDPSVGEVVLLQAATVQTAVETGRFTVTISRL